MTDGGVLEHLRETLRVSEGSEIRCTVLGAGHCTGTVREIGADKCRLELGAVTLGKAQWFDLVVGLSRPQTSKKILEHGTTFGARRFHFFKAALSDKSYLDSKIFVDRAYEEFLVAGLAQAATYTDLPEFKLDKYNIAHQYKDTPQTYILDLDTDRTFLDLPLDFTRPITLAIGPERGFIPSDIEKFHAAGFQSVRVSASTLRVEYATCAAISQLELLKNHSPPSPP